MRKERKTAVSTESSDRYTLGFSGKVMRRISLACVVLHLVFAFLSLCPQDTMRKEECLSDVGCGERAAIPCAITQCLTVTSSAEDLAVAVIVISQRASLEVSCPKKAETIDMGKDLHSSALHQGLDELQQVSGDDRDGTLQEQFQISHNLDSQKNKYVTYSSLTLSL